MRIPHDYHARIRFPGDGSVWLLRVSRISSSISQSLADYLIYMFGYGLANDKNNIVGNMQGPHGKRFADDTEKKRVWDGLAEILIEIQRHPFQRQDLFSQVLRLPSRIVSANASERFLVQSPSGHFDKVSDYYTSFMEQNMALIAVGQLFTSFPVNAYLVFSFLKSQIPALPANLGPDSSAATEQFYIKYMDDKGDQLMVDDEPNIIGIIDWQMPRVVLASEAFGPSPVTAEMGVTYNGKSSLTIHDHALARFLKVKGAADLAEIMSKDERLRIFFFCLDVDLPWNESLLLIRGIWTCIHDGRLKRIVDRFGEGP
ncbi:hypothetical protein BDV38DRAFT_289542 [Aspergillus pseudotamarii]|uniref:Aminoglycoside phosphotransferase domain-containing protein n=1 Tax=Aspergillus pseudotamarii TaxID=132259 RepID=A0A5N6TBT3_ASPPS|nr:uncharacterized protein BDV38DRAFT_289542 [Aspergillus pseudotamarii]KAE8143629.1 hypothetical protein BDV38DRAFT_289542 [Aspergillus pseudotamarii]